eukprot:CAMPEP_0171251194 /NCGR_PEP_ID=MMETSP0790-20130122/50510_1 /TAXON_ID=2925 /ORGANISM="Alexandrium catenella, Strain OF101" /LENGTH=30 /DNA_ID= /DNA_START= /DNA_END= /DNA_ORIENTATION=
MPSREPEGQIAPAHDVGAAVARHVDTPKPS